MSGTCPEDYLDRTNRDLRGSRSLLFMSFLKGIRPTTLSSWLKQTILLCYKQADQQALDLIQDKAHDIRAFVAAKAFYGDRALRYYLDRTSDLRQNKELVFLSFKKGFNKDISLATVLSWIMQIVILCYELSDLNKVKRP